MTNEEYLQTQRHIVALARLVAELPLKEFITAAERADTVGPIIDPTLWMQGHDGLGSMLDIARGLRNFQDIVLTKQQLLKR